MSILQTTELKKYYGAKPNITRALDGVTLSIEKGEFVAIVGTSGSGKSTLLNMIGGLDVPTSGKVIVDGRELSTLKDEQLTIFRRRKIGFIFQNYNLVPVLNVYENIVLPVELDGNKVDKKFMKEVVQMLGLEDKLNNMPNNLSGGQQQRVAIARAVVNNPKVLLLDEPLGALDYKLRKKMQLELKNLQRGLGITFIYVTHDQEEALTMSDRVIIVKDGRIEQDDPPAAIYQYPKSQFAAGFIGENNFFDIEGDEDHVLAVRPQFIEVSKESEDLEGTPKEPFYYGSVVELLFTGTFDKVFIRLDNTNQMVTAYQYYDDKKRWKADDRVGIRWNAEEAVKVIK